MRRCRLSYPQQSAVAYLLLRSRRCESPSACSEPAKPCFVGVFSLLQIPEPLQHFLLFLACRRRVPRLNSLAPATHAATARVRKFSACLESPSACSTFGSRLLASVLSLLRMSCPAQHNLLCLA